MVEGSRYEAEAAKRELEAELEAEVSGAARARLTLGDYALQWLEARSASLKPSTRAKYVNDLEGHILPALGDVQLDELRPRDVAVFLARNEGAPNSKKNRLALLRVMAKDALADELIDRDFCLRVSVKVPKVYTQDQPNILGGDLLDAVIERIPWYWLDMSCTLSYTGLRWGEVTALHWPELDFKRKEATVKWTNWKGILGRPKTETGVRVVPLADPLPEMLRERRRRMKAERHPGLARRLVFPTKQGTLHKGNPLGKVLEKACHEAGVTIRFTPHGLRRTWNNIARRLAGGLVVRAMIGHASEAMTDHYSLVDGDEKRETAEAVVALLRRKRGGDNQKSAAVPEKETTAAPTDSQPRSLVDEPVDDDLETPSPIDPKPE